MKKSTGITKKTTLWSPCQTNNSKGW